MSDAELSRERLIHRIVRRAMDSQMDREQDDQVVVVGRIQAPFGVRGWVHLNAFTEPPENILSYRPLLIRDAGDNRHWRALEVDEIRTHRKAFVARLAGIEDRTAAERLKGSLLGVARAALVEPEANEYYWRDLIGVNVVDQHDRRLGEVTQLMETGAHDVLVIKPDADLQNDGDLLIPFHANFVLDVDLPGAAIRVAWDLEERDLEERDLEERDLEERDSEEDGSGSLEASEH